MSQPAPVATIDRKPNSIPQTGQAARLAIRSGEWNGPTSGIAPGYVQGNLAILPAALASDFMRFCQLNPKPCPLLAAGAPGDPSLPSLAADLDIRTDLGRYKVFRNGELVDEPTDLMKHWRDDLVIFALGCSFSFEDALIQDGMELRHITNGTTVPMYRTNVQTTAAGPFHGPLVVSMAAAETRRRDPRHPDHDAVSGGARRPRACRHAGADRHQGHHEARLWRSGADQFGRDAGVLGLRRDAAIGGRDHEAGVLHHALSGLHAGNGPEEFRIRDSTTLTCAATTCQPSAKRTHVCIWRPTLPFMASRWNSVEATAKSRP